MKRTSQLLGLLIASTGMAAPTLQAQSPPATPAATQVIVEKPGRPDPPPYAISSRNRIALAFGYWNAPEDPASHPAVYSGAYNNDLSVGLEYTRFLSEGLAVSLGAHVLAIDAGSSVSRSGVFSGSRTVVFVPFGVRLDPSGGEARGRSVKPYLLGGLGPVFGTEAGSGASWHGVRSGAHTETTIGARLGGGVDVMLGRSWTLSVEAAYNWMDDFERAIGAHRDYGGFELRVGIGWLFGKGRPVAD